MLFLSHCQITVSGMQVASQLNAAEQVSSGSPYYFSVRIQLREEGNEIP